VDTRLSELGIGEASFAQYAEDSARVLRDQEKNLLGHPALSKDDIVAVLKSAL